MTFYTSIILLTELIMLAMTLHVVRYSGFTRQQKAWFLISFIAVMFCAAAEFLAITFDGRAGAFLIPLAIITAVQFSITPTLPVFFVGALGMRRAAKSAAYVFAVHALLELALLPFGLIFRFDENGKYHRGDLYIIYEVFYIISLLFLIVCLFIIGKRFKKRDALTIVMVLVIMVAGIVPLVFFKIYTDYICIAISACICYIYYNDLVQQDIQSELISNQQKANRMQEHIISGMASLIENRGTDSGGHVELISSLVKTLAEDARSDGVYADTLTDDFISKLFSIAPMHDIGKVVVSDEILKKPDKLTDEEYEQMKAHASSGGSVIRSVFGGMADDEYLEFASAIATYHHERWDGLGYPDGLAGEEIPLSARIMAIADFFDELISERHYKTATPAEEALAQIREGAGTQFDPLLAEVFLNHKEDFLKIYADI